MNTTASTRDAGNTPVPGAAILLVDDRPENLLALDALLAPLAAETGVRVLHAHSGEEALRITLREGDALAVLLLDVMMPGMDGPETARRIRAETRSEHVPIIFVTALDSDRRRVSLGYLSGAVDYLTKPLDPELVEAKVRAFLDLHRRRGEVTLRERRRYADEAAVIRQTTLREDAALVSTIQRIGTALASELDLERIVQLVTDEATALTGAEFGAFFYTTTEPGTGAAFPLYALAGVPREHFAHFAHPRATPVLGPTFRGEGAVRSADITKDPRFGQMEPYHGMPPGHLPVRSYLAVPVRSRSGDVLGGLFFGHADVGVFGEREERLVVGIAGWAAIAVDNAQLYAAERRARQAAEAAQVAAEQADRAKSVFLATMSHEFRTPLNAVQGYAQLLELEVGGTMTEAQRAYLRRLRIASDHLLGLVNNVLDLSRLDAGELPVAHSVAGTAAAVESTLALTQPLADAKQIALVDLCSEPALRADEGSTNGPSPQVTYLGDEHRVRQILVNLVSNAVKFSSPGSRVELECARVARGCVRETSRERPEGTWTVIRVRDTGRGIEAEQHEAVFGAFVQLDSRHTRNAEGAGLGLALSRRLARLMGGDVTVESTPGAGSTFTLWLPAPP